MKNRLKVWKQRADEQAVKLAEETIALRRRLHRNPELGLREHQTADYVAEFLRGIGLETVTGVGGTGVTGLLRGKGNRTLLIRSDMDALPILEETGLPFTSCNPGIMHACGHDGHMAIVMTTAKILAGLGELPQNIKFVFEPNEEEAGASRMIADNVLDAPAVTEALGIHLWSYLRTGAIAIQSGPMMASSYYFHIVVKGKGGHAGAPHMAVNPINVASKLIEAGMQFAATKVDPLEPVVVSFCKVNAGSTPVIIPDRLELEGSIRCLHKEDAAVRREFEQLMVKSCEAEGAQCFVSYVCGNSLLINDERMTQLVYQAAKEIVGEDHIVHQKVGTMLGDDFAEFSQRVPGAYFFVGAGNSEKGTDYPHHHPRFDLDEDSLLIGTRMVLRCALDWMESAQ